MSVVPGQNIGSIRWPLLKSSGWLTDCVPVHSDYEVPEVFDWSEPETDEPFPADADIAAGRVCSFDSIEDLIANLKLPD